MSEDHAFAKISGNLIENPFRPPWFLRDKHSQTIITSLQNRTFPSGWREYREETADLASGVQVQYRSIGDHDCAPTLIVLHGMTGSYDSGYMLGLSHKAFAEGWNALLPNLYDTAIDSPLKIFHSGSSDLARELLERLAEIHRLRDVFLVSVSMGANIMLKLFGEWGDKRPEWLRAAVAISPLFDLKESWQPMERWENRIYQIHFTKRLKRIVSSRAERWGSRLDLERVSRCQTIRQFDDSFTAPLAGFDDAMHYYRECSACDVAQRVRVPTLVLHARDDPFLPWEPLVRRTVSGNPALLVHLTDRGGHLGFLEHSSTDRDNSWSENRAIDFFRLYHSSCRPRASSEVGRS